MRIVVTGAGGFVGRYLCRRLAGTGHEFIAVSRRPATGRVVVSDYRQVPSGDVLIHLAQEADRVRFNADGERAVNESVDLLDALLEFPWQQIVFASSAVVYGDHNVGPIGTDTPTVASDPYSRCKLACEARVLEYGGVVTRLANLYGEGMAPGSVVANILAQIPGQGAVKVRDTTPVRDFLHVEDAAAAIAIMASTSAHGVFNVGSGDGISVGELASLALESAGEQHRGIESKEAATRLYPSSCILDITGTTRHVGWQPTIPLRQGLSNLLAAKGLLHRKSVSAIKES